MLFLRHTLKSWRSVIRSIQISSFEIRKSLVTPLAIFQAGKAYRRCRILIWKSHGQLPKGCNGRRRRLLKKNNTLSYSHFYSPFAKALSSIALRKQRSEEHTSELQSRFDLVCRLLLEKKKKIRHHTSSQTTVVEIIGAT